MTYVSKKKNMQKDDEEQIKQEATALALLIFDTYQEKKRTDKKL